MNKPTITQDAAEISRAWADYRGSVALLAAMDALPLAADGEPDDEAMSALLVTLDHAAEKVRRVKHLGKMHRNMARWDRMISEFNHPPSPIVRFRPSSCFDHIGRN